MIQTFYLSVLLFFVLSAFTLSHSNQVAPTTYAAYLTRRFFRIAPLFYIVLAWNLDRVGYPGAAVLLANLTFTFNLMPGQEQSLVWAGWSVGVEMLFYLILPLLLLSCRDVSRTLGILVATTVLSILLWWRLDSDPALSSSYAYVFIGSNLAIFCAGIFGYRLYSAVKGSALATREVLMATSMGLLLVASLDPAYLQYKAAGAYFTMWALAFATLCVWQAAFPARLLVSKAIQWLGDRSYSIYLLHPIVIELSRPIYRAIELELGIEGMALYFATLTVTLPILFALAEGTYRFIEIPGMRMGTSLAPRLSRKPQASIRTDLARGQLRAPPLAER